MRIKTINNKDAQLLANDINYFMNNYKIISINCVYNSNANFYTAFIMYEG